MGGGSVTISRWAVEKGLAANGRATPPPLGLGHPLPVYRVKFEVGSNCPLLAVKTLKLQIEPIGALGKGGSGFAGRHGAEKAIIG